MIFALLPVRFFWDLEAEVVCRVLLLEMWVMAQAAASVSPDHVYRFNLLV